MARAVVITGPSGVGKGTLIRALRDRVPELELSVSATTRSPRPGEENGIHYWFLNPETFEELVDEGGFVEHAEFSGNRYGTLRSELESRVADGRPLLLEIEVQGARQVRATRRSSVPRASFGSIVGSFAAATSRTRLPARGCAGPRPPRGLRGRRASRAGPREGAARGARARPRLRRRRGHSRNGPGSSACRPSRSSSP